MSGKRLKIKDLCGQIVKIYYVSFYKTEIVPKDNEVLDSFRDSRIIRTWPNRGSGYNIDSVVSLKVKSCMLKDPLLFISTVSGISVEY